MSKSYNIFSASISLIPTKITWMVVQRYITNDYEIINNISHDKYL